MVAIFNVNFFHRRHLKEIRILSRSNTINSAQTPLEDTLNLFQNHGTMESAQEWSFMAVQVCHLL